MVSNNKIKLGVAGRTNVGKTTLIRTLTRTNVGEVADAANVTKKGDIHEHDTLLAYFVDSPGFQHASSLDDYYTDVYEETGKYPNLESVIQKFSKGNRLEKYQYDIEAIKAMHDTDALVYVASLSDVPNDSYASEISVLHKIQPNIIGVLNQYISQCKKTSKAEVNNRIYQWQELFQRHNIEVLVIDAHWETPVKINKLYEMLKNILASDKRSVFFHSLQEFKSKQIEYQKAVCEILFEYIQKICKTCFNTHSMIKNQFDNPAYVEELKQELKAKTDSISKDFILKVTDFYKTASELPNAPLSEIQYSINHREVNLSKKKELAEKSGDALGVLGGILGLGIGLVVAIGSGGTLTQGVPVLGGLGKSIGSLLGTFIGDLEYDREEDIVTIVANKNIITNFVICYLALTWGISQVGFGRGRKLSIKEIEYLSNSVADISKKYFEATKNKSFDDLNWVSTSAIEKSEIIRILDTILNILGNKEIEVEEFIRMTESKVG